MGVTHVILPQWPSQRTDFTRSNIRWVVRESKSLGGFRVESVLRIMDGAGVVQNVYVLGVAVIAGRLYVSEMSKAPSYLFQLVTSQTEHRILRTYTQPEAIIWNVLRGLLGRRKMQDTFALHETTFESLQVNLVMRPARSFSRFEDVYQTYQNGEDFAALIRIQIGPDRVAELEFPVNHLNMLPSRSIFQIETGPVLFPHVGALIAGQTLDLRNLIPSFVHFNTTDHAEFSVDFPFAVRHSAVRGQFVVKTVPCQTQFLADAVIG